MKYRVGLIGAGGISRLHGQAIAQTDCAELVAVCSRSQETVKQYCDEFNVPAGYTHLGDMLDKEKLDIAIICTWGCSHYELSNQIANSQKVRAILCEKPMSQTAAECEGMVRTAQENGVLLAEAFKFRHHPMHLKAREIIDSGQIGSLRNIRSTFCINIADEHRTPDFNWRFNKEKGGGAVYDLGCYNIHHARFIAGADPLSVYAVGQYGPEVDDTVCATLAFPHHVTAQLMFSFKIADSEYVEISGTEGTLYAEQAWNNENKATRLEVRTREGKEVHDFEPFFQFQNQIEHLCACLSSGRDYLITPENSLGNMKTIDAVNESMRTGQVVRLS